MEDYAIRTYGLVTGYGRRRSEVTVNGPLDLCLGSGKVTGLMGRNGAGKSTLIRTLCGLQNALKGSVEVLGRPLQSYGSQELATTIGTVLTERAQGVGAFTVRELVSMGRYPHTGFFGRLSAEDESIVDEAMSVVGISEKRNSNLSDISDGECQKAYIAKALAQQCPVIILDEPTAFLDVTSRMDVMLALRNLAVSQGKAVLLSTHDLETAIQMSDELWLLGRGDNMVCGTPDELCDNGSLGRFFNSGDMTFDPVRRSLVPVVRV